MATCNCGVLSRLPIESVYDIYNYLDEATLYGTLPCVSTAISRCSTTAPRRRAAFTLRHSSAVKGLTDWLSSHGQHLEHLKLAASAWEASSAPAAKAALWTALSNQANTQRLCSLQLDMPFTPDDEAAVIGAVCASTPSLRALHLHYQRPLSHARRASAVCFCTHSSPALWSGAAAHLRQLRITGACLCNMRGVVQLTSLETLEVSCCNTLDAVQEFCSVLQYLPQLHSFSYTTSKPTPLSFQTAQAIAAASNLTHLELGNFVLPMGAGNAALSLDAAVVPPATAAAALSAAGPCRMQLAQLLSHLHSLHLVDCSWVAASLPVFGGLTQLTSFAVVRSSGDGSFMPVLSQLLSCSDSDSDSDSELDSDTESIDSDDQELDREVACSGNGHLVALGQPSSSSSCCCSTALADDAADVSASCVVACSSPVKCVRSSRRRQNKQAAALSSLGLLYNLQELDLCGFNLHSISPISSLQQLRTLRLGRVSALKGCKDSSSSIGMLTTRGLAGVVALQQLELLDVSYNRLTADCLPLLAVLTKLTHLDLAGNSLGGGFDRCSSCCTCEECQLLCHTMQECGLGPGRACSPPSSISAYSTVGCCSNSSCSAMVGFLGDCNKAVISADSLSNHAEGCSAATAAGSCGGDTAVHLSCQDQERLLLTDGSSSGVARSIPAAVAATAAVTAASAPGAEVSRPYLRHLDISGCGLTRLPDVFDLAGLTCLRAGTALAVDSRGRQGTQTNMFSACTVAAVCNLTRLQDLELAASTPTDSQSYSRLTALTALTRLVLQDPNAALSLFSAPTAAASRGAALSNLQELGLMVISSSLNSEGWTAAMQQLVSKCRGLKRLSLTPWLVADAQTDEAPTGDAAADICCAGGQQNEAEDDEECCAASGCCPTAAVCQAPSAAGSDCTTAVQGLATLGAAATVDTACIAADAAGPVTHGMCNVGSIMERVGSGYSGMSRCSTPCTTGCSSSSSNAGGSCSSNRDGTSNAPWPSDSRSINAGCCSKQCSVHEAGCYSALAGLSGLTRLDLAAPADLDLAVGTLSGMSRLRHLQLLPGCQDSPIVAAAGTVPGCCGLGPSTGLVASAVGLGVSRRFIGDGQLMSLSVLTGLCDLDLSQVAVSDAAVEQLHLMLPCTKVTGASPGHARLFA